MRNVNSRWLVFDLDIRRVSGHWPVWHLSLGMPAGHSQSWLHHGCIPAVVSAPDLTAALRQPVLRVSAVILAVLLQAGDSKKGNFKIMLMDNKPLGSIAKLLSASSVKEDQVEVRRA